MATKKPRTPTPPRPVQAPKRRDSKRAPGPAGMSERNARWLLYGLAALGPIALAIVLGVVFLGGSSTKDANGSAPDIDYAALPGIQRTKAPWAPEYASLPDRLKPLGLNALSGELLAYHIHQHLDIFIDGKKTPVPTNIGIDDGAFITELHTHDASGIIHVEAGKVFPYSLGQFFGAWGVRLSKDCIGAYCARSQPVRFYVNGKPYNGNPNDLVLKNHQEIVVTVGKPPKKIPSTYPWAKAGV